MKPDPRVQRAEKLVKEALRLLAEITAGVPAPRRRRRRRRRFQLPRILAALRDGASLKAPAAERDPRLPSLKVLAKYRASNRAFDRQASEILKERHRAAARMSRQVVAGAKDWAARLPGERHDWEAIAAKIEGGATIGPYSPNRQGLPSHTIIMARRMADPVFGRRVAAAIAARFGRLRRKAYDREAVLSLIVAGAVIKAWPPEPGMPPKYALDRDRREDPAFDVQVKAAIKEALRRRRNRMKLAKLTADAPWRIAEGAVPKSLDPEIRDDVVGELALLICSGEVGSGPEAALAWRSCRAKLTGHRWKETSLDAPVAGLDGVRRIDLVSADAERY